MFEVGSIVARVKADISDFKSGMSEAGHHSSRFHDGLGMVAGGIRALATGLAIGGAAAAAFGGIATKEFSESEDAASQLNTVLKSTGGIAGVTADQALGLADAFSKETKFSDEAVLSAENMLLTFTNIGKEVFPQATQTVLDMSQALGQDTKSSAIQLGKALQDPINGITALRRVGVNFTDAQQEVITKMVEAGDVMGAQKLILKELGTEFGGSAQAAGSTFSGQVTIAKNNFSNFMEIIGKGIVDQLGPLITAFNQWVDESGGVQGAMDRVVASLKNIWNTIVTALRPALDTMVTVWEILKPSLMSLAETIMTQLWPALKRLWDQISPILIPALAMLAAIIGAALVGAMWLMINVLNGLTVVISAVINWMSGWVSVTKSAAVGIVSAFNWIKDTGTGIFNSIRGGIQSIIDKFGQITGAVRNSLSGMWDAVRGSISGPIDWAKNKVNELVNKLKDLNPFKRHSPSLFDLVSKGTEAIRREYSDMFGGIGMMAQKFSAVNLAPSLANPSASLNPNVNTSIYGNVNIGSEVDANNFMTRLTRNQELAQRGMSTI